MRGLNLQQCLAVILYLVGPRRGYIMRLKTGAAHLLVFDGLLPELNAAVTRFNARRLGLGVHLLAVRHMEAAAALAMALRAKAVDFLVTAEVRDAAKVVFEEMLAGRLGPTLSNAERVTLVINTHELRVAAAPQLALLPPALVEMVDAWIAIGDAFVEGINDRTDREDEGTRNNFELVSAVRAALGNLRAGIRSEQAMYPELPATLESQILGMADELGRRRRTPKAVELVDPVVGSGVPAESVPVEAAPADVAPAESTESAPADVAPTTPVHGPESHVGHS